jgi:hypothetical protein
MEDKKLIRGRDAIAMVHAYDTYFENIDLVCTMVANKSYFVPFYYSIGSLVHASATFDTN